MTSTSFASPTAAVSSAVPAPAVPAPAMPAPRIDTGWVSDLIAQLLVALGEDPAREGLTGTPERVASWWNTSCPQTAPRPRCASPRHTSAANWSSWAASSVWSLCEHHMLPMNLQVAAGYVPAGEVVGLSKFARIAQRHAGRLQVQERFTRQVAEEIACVIGSDDVAVAVRGTHLCMSMRGVRMEAARTSSLQAGGRFESDPVLSQQFLALATAHHHIRPE